MNNKVTVVNCETGETFERDLTPEEIQINEMQDEKYQQQIAEAEAKATAKAALLAQLGITEEQAKLLLS
jgi:hypothetical protein